MRLIESVAPDGPRETVVPSCLHGRVSSLNGEETPTEDPLSTWKRDLLGSRLVCKGQVLLQKELPIEKRGAGSPYGSLFSTVDDEFVPEIQAVYARAA